MLYYDTVLLSELFDLTTKISASLQKLRTVLLKSMLSSATHDLIQISFQILQLIVLVHQYMMSDINTVASNCSKELKEQLEHSWSYRELLLSNAQHLLNTCNRLNGNAEHTLPCRRGNMQKKPQWICFNRGVTDEPRNMQPLYHSVKSMSTCKKRNKNKTWALIFSSIFTETRSK